jgi:hypothetical protein
MSATAAIVGGAPFEAAVVQASRAGGLIAAVGFLNPA